MWTLAKTHSIITYIPTLSDQFDFWTAYNYSEIKYDHIKNTCCEVHFPEPVVENILHCHIKGETLQLLII